MNRDSGLRCNRKPNFHQKLRCQLRSTLITLSLGIKYCMHGVRDLGLIVRELPCVSPSCDICEISAYQFAIESYEI